MGEIWDNFIAGFCKVEFLCYATEPNWLGWLVMVIGPVYAFYLVILSAHVAVGFYFKYIDSFSKFWD